MRNYLPLLAILAVFGLMFLFSPAPVVASESADGGERVDLPDEHPYEIPAPPEEEEEEEDPGEDPEPPEEEPEPPVEFFDTPIETDEVVYVVDRTGSMAYAFSGTATDLEGNTVFGATKMQATNFELKRSIMNLSENVTFNASYYAHRWGTLVGGHICGTYNAASPYRYLGHGYDPIYAPGPIPASHKDPPGSEPDVVTWQGDLVPATEQNKASAFAWIDVRGTSNGCTCISDGCVNGGLCYQTKTLFLLTDGWPNTFARTIYFSDPGCGGYDVDYVFNRTKAEIKAGNQNGTTIHTFYIPYGNASMDGRCRQLMQEIAAMNGPGTFTQIGG
ncbi:MAG: hypothetical protein ACYS8W_07935 [Planctomycetota bacterium]|jgi:hypothetical protein